MQPAITLGLNICRTPGKVTPSEFQQTAKEWNTIAVDDLRLINKDIGTFCALKESGVRYNQSYNTRSWVRTMGKGLCDLIKKPLVN